MTTERLDERANSSASIRFPTLTSALAEPLNAFTNYCLHERGGDDGFAYQHLTMARFNREWIEQNKHPSP